MILFSFFSKPLYVIYDLWLLNQHLENCWICPWNLTYDIEGLTERLQIQLRGFWHISLPKSFSKVFERSQNPFTKELLSLDPAMMVELIGLIL